MAADRLIEKLKCLLSNNVVTCLCRGNLITDVVRIRGRKLYSCGRKGEARVQHVSFVAAVLHAARCPVDIV